MILRPKITESLSLCFEDDEAIPPFPCATIVECPRRYVGPTQVEIGLIWKEVELFPCQPDPTIRALIVA
jgi:hypothetical protein